MLAMLVLLSGTLTSCSSEPERSTQAFCDTFRDESLRLNDKYQTRIETVESDALASLLVGFSSLIESQGDMVVMMDRLSKVAPPDIEPETIAVHDHLQQQMQAMTDTGSSITGLVLSGIVTSMQMQGAYDRLDKYVVGNCDLGWMGG